MHKDCDITAVTENVRYRVGSVTSPTGDVTLQNKPVVVADQRQVGCVD
jgi:hypothetical protein